ncbi:MAG: response regulator [Rhodospirillales bacterium]|nr:response regulator [Rhodospirillales bacterium]
MKIKTITEIDVLVIDDDRHMRSLIRNILFALGAKDVVEAGDGKHALSELKAFKPDLILCDLKMAPVGGMEFVRQLRADKSNPNRLVPIIMITAYAELEAVSRARDSGVNEFMAKPLSAASLEQRIRRTLEDPRGFVETETYAGPDRRRNKKGSVNGPERRATKPHLIKSAELSAKVK